jgi:hypothetical protein
MSREIYGEAMVWTALRGLYRMSDTDGGACHMAVIFIVHADSATSISPSYAFEAGD